MIGLLQTLGGDDHTMLQNRYGKQSVRTNYVAMVMEILYNCYGLSDSNLKYGSFEPYS